ncbi:MAG: rhomboid family intramembrane serine protease [Polyangiales bacterium]
MRLLRELDEPTAQRLVDALAEQGIESELKPAGEAFGVWVIDETHMERAGELAAQWVDQGDREAFEQSASRGRRARELDLRIEERRQRHIETLTQKLQAASRPRPAPLTWLLIAVCAGLFFLTECGERHDVVAALSIADPRVRPDATLISLFGQVWVWLELPLREPWRLITPVLMHAHPLHIAFNMLWLHELGRTIESAHGSRYLAVFVVICAVVSNVAQYEITQRPNFAGMSGVVYGLFGLIWLRGRFDPWIGYGLSSSTTQLMLIWLALGFIGNFGIANYCHLFGLLVGVCWAYVANKLSRR